MENGWVFKRSEPYKNRMTPLQKVLTNVLTTVTPPQTSLKLVKTFLHDVNSELKKKKVNATAVLGGSYAKGVWIAGAHDVDIFVRFKKENKKQETRKQKQEEETISDTLGTVLKRWNPERVH